MANTVRDAAARAAILSRFEKLAATAKPLWGKMSAVQMVQHVTAPMLTAMGELPVPARPGLLRTAMMRYLIIHVLPWPKGAPTAKEYMPADTGDMKTHLAHFEETLERFGTRAEAAVWTEHPAFGNLTMKDWDCLTSRHLDHHLRQFGL